MRHLIKYDNVPAENSEDTDIVLAVLLVANS